MNTEKKKPPEVLQLRPPGTGKGTLKALGGSLDDDFNSILANQVASSLWRAHSDGEDLTAQFRAAFAGLTAIQPADEKEGMLGALMVSAYAAAMESYRRAMLAEQTFEGRQDNLNSAVKLSRVYAELMLGLDKHRGKGEQRVTVEHIHIHQGGQAIVGNVQSGGGVSPKSEELPHDQQVTHAPVEAMPSEIEAVGEALPITGR